MNRKILCAFAMSLFLFLSAATTYSQIDPNQTYLIQARHSGMFLQPEGSSKRAGSRITQNARRGAMQSFKFVPVGRGYYRIVNQDSGLVIDIRESSKTDGADVLQWTYNATPNQHFMLRAAGDGYFTIIAQHSGKQLDVFNSDRNSGARLIQFSGHNGTNQQFRLIPVSNSPNGNTDAGGIEVYRRALNYIRGNLTTGVSRIAAPGVPGPLLLTGAQAYPIVTSTGGNGIEQPVVAASYMGKGRVVAFGHPGFFSAADSKFADTGRLISNSIAWTSGKGSSRLRVGLVGPGHLAEMLSRFGHSARNANSRDWSNGLRDFDTVLAWPPRLSASQIRTLSAFVKNGGGLLAADLGWGWQQINAGKDLISENPSNNLLRPAGITWVRGYSSDPPNGYVLKRSVSPLANAQMALMSVRTSNATSIEARLQAWMSVSRAAVLPSYGTEVDRYILSAKGSSGFPGGHFPAYVARSVPRVSARISIPAGKMNIGRPAWHSTGLYAAPGDVITVRVDRSAINKGLRIQIGSHTDKLWNKKKWDRFPDVVRSRPVTTTQVQISSPFGGLIYVVSPGRTNLPNAAFSFQRVIRAPSFVYGQDSLSDWRNRIRRYPAPWAELVSDKVVLTIPSETIRKIDDPVRLMRFWNYVLDLTNDLAVRSRNRDRPERIVADKQISAGYMHSGYPIMTHLDAAERMGNIGQLQTAWGLYHELGHNHQHRDWTFNGTVEVTCNLFTLYIREFATRTSPRKAFMDLGKRPSPEVYFERQRRTRASEKFDKWKKDPFLALAMYIQLQEAFGWDTYKKVFREYSRLAPNQRPKNDLEKRDQWMVRFSKATGYSLERFFREWGVPVSDKARREIAHLPVWMPRGTG